MKRRRVGFLGRILNGVVFSVVVIFMATACQPAGTGQPVTLPVMTLTCTTGHCATANGSYHFVVYLTSAGCSNPEFAARLSLAGQVTCSSGSCSGMASSWVNGSGKIETTISASTYDFCAFIYLVGDPSAGDPASGDMTGSLENRILDGSGDSLSQTIRSWSNVP